MKICFKDLLNIADEKKYDLKADYIEVKDNTFITGIKDVSGDVYFYYDNDDLIIDYKLKGIMICPDSMTLEPVEVPFDIENNDVVTKDSEEEGFYFDKDMTLEEFISYVVIPEAPIIVENPNKKGYYSKGNWTILTEEEYNKRCKEEIDPRLAKLLEYREE